MKPNTLNGCVVDNPNQTIAAPIFRRTCARHEQEVSLISQWLRTCVAALTLITLGCGGCALQSSHIDGGHGYGVHLYSFFDNSRDEGPNYLVGPSDRLGSWAATSNSVETTSALFSRAVTSKLDPLAPALPQVNEWAVAR
jgi:hypothetical protein